MTLSKNGKSSFRINVKVLRFTPIQRRYAMPTEMKDEGKGGEDRVNKMKEEQQKEMEKKGPEEVGKYPEPEGDTKKDVPPGT
jgi:hypothetical protein